jgi:PD-(D/E)XK endonuclease
VFASVNGLTSNEKGAIAEAHVVASAIRAGIVVLRPLIDGRRYDLMFDFGDGRIERVQCKWARMLGGDVIVARIRGCRHSPTRGYVWSEYDASEIDAFALYCAELNRCFYVPINEVTAKTDLRLRLKPTRNGQQSGVTMAADYELGAVAQLGERRAGSAKVRGSSPLSSTPRKAA